MLPFQPDLNYEFSLKFHFKNIFPSLAILSHVDKTKSAKLTPNIPPSIDQAFPWLLKNEYSI